MGLDANACTVTLDQPRSVTASFMDLGPPSAAITTPPSRSPALFTSRSASPFAGSGTDNVPLRTAGGGAVATAAHVPGADGTPVSCSEGLRAERTARPASPLLAGQSYVVVANSGRRDADDRRPSREPPAEDDRELPRGDRGPGGGIGVFVRLGSPRRRPGDGRVCIDGATGRGLDHPRVLGSRPSRSGRSPDPRSVAPGSRSTARIERRIDRYRPSFAAVPRTFTRSGHGAHTLQVSIVAPGPGHPGAISGRGSMRIADVNGVRRTPAGAAARWGAATAASAAGGRYVVSSGGRRPSVVPVPWPGGDDHDGHRTPRFGRAEIWVDGTLKRRIDLSAATTTFGVARTVGWSHRPGSYRPGRRPRSAREDWIGHRGGHRRVDRRVADPQFHASRPTRGAATRGSNQARARRRTPRTR